MNSNTKFYHAVFTSDCLGTKPSDPYVHETFIAGKEREAMKDELDAEERALAELDALKKGRLIFHRDENGNPIIYDYMLKGFLKEAFRSLSRDPKNPCAKIKAFIKIIDGCIFTGPRQIPIHLPEGVEKTGVCERALRAQTAMGERVALASSETVPEGSEFWFSVTTMIPGLDRALAECWEYAQFRFLGGWRNSGKGTAKITRVKELGSTEEVAEEFADEETEDTAEQPAKRKPGRPKKTEV